MQLSTLVLPVGGHNFRTFAAELPVAFGWLSRYAPAPLAPLSTVDGLSPQPVLPGSAGTKPPPGRSPRAATR